ncbi:MAG: phosphatidate cytidylyltransferase [Bacteroidales bacterium]|nr:phosphatidate cytidylyltransferase [Bacteroidales bacterium]
MSSLSKRIASGLIFFIIVAGALLCSWTFLALMVAICALMMDEYYSMTLRRRFNPEQTLMIFAAISAIVLLFLTFRCGLDGKYLLFSFLPVIATCISSIYTSTRELRKGETDKGVSPDIVNHIAHLMMPVLYIAAPLMLIQFLVFDPSGYTPWLLLSILILIWLNDVGAYMFGTLFGQRKGSCKLFPSVSPKKSWAGLWGGVVISFLVAILLYRLTQSLSLLNISWWHWLVMAALVVVFGVFGDLFESLLKRACNVKDSGNIMPGHGGLLDRFDTMLFVIPVIVLYLKMVCVI